MLNQLLKFTLVSSALLWLRPRWKGLLALVVFVLMVHVLHGEYLSYVELSENDEFLVWSYVVKWTALILGVLVYFLVVLSGGGSAAEPAALFETRNKPRALPRGGAATDSAVDDGFDFLRDKKQLQSRAEKLLAKPDPDSR